MGDNTTRKRTQSRKRAPRGSVLVRVLTKKELKARVRALQAAYYLMKGYTKPAEISEAQKEKVGEIWRQAQEVLNA